MAKVFSNPIPAPAFADSNGSFDVAGYEKRCEEYREATENYIRTELTGKCKHTGKIIRFPIADGYAQYMVWTLTKLIHLDEGDGWHADAATLRGMRAVDVAEKVERGERLAGLFAK
jgi:hypothetical protein